MRVVPVCLLVCLMTLFFLASCDGSGDGDADGDADADGEGGLDLDADVDSTRPVDADSSVDSDTVSDDEADVEVAHDGDVPHDAEVDESTCGRADPYPAPLLDDSGLFQTGWGAIEWRARDGNALIAYTYRASGFDPDDGPILFVMHGVSRDAYGYLDAWDQLIEDAHALGIAPEFPSDLYESSESYNFGVGLDGTPYGGTYDPTEWRDGEDTTHSEIEHLFEAVKDALDSGACDYLIYGHSAGSQFVHRLLTFRPDARVRRAVAANAGWYTLPSTGGGSDPHYFMPYGLQGAPLDPTRLPLLFSRELVVMLGEEDTERTDDLRQTDEADFQGLNRLERGQFYHEVAVDEAASLGVSLDWTLVIVPGVAHSNSDMAPYAAERLF